MATRYRPPSKAPRTAWAIHIDRFMRENGLSQTQAFELVQKALGLGPKSRAAFLPFLANREPNEEEAQALASAFGWPEERDEIRVESEGGDQVAAAIDRQTAVISELLAEFRQTRLDRERLHAIETQLAALVQRSQSVAMHQEAELDRLERELGSSMSPRPTPAPRSEAGGSEQPRPVHGE